MLERFDILGSEGDQSLEGLDYPLLLNLNQIASIKNINIVYRGNIIQGYWVRMVSGKKYKATRIPFKLQKALHEESGLTELKINDEVISNLEVEPTFQ